jgi:5-methylcytosine-specific restriction endonuclease McrA
MRPVDSFEGFASCSVCRKRRRESMKRWRDRNLEEALARCQAWKTTNVEQNRANARRWAVENNEQYRERIRLWQAENPERTKAAMKSRTQRRRARKADATVETFTQDDLVIYWITHGINPRQCFYCAAPYEHTDHVVPLFRGGNHERSNLVPACGPCNDSKGYKLLSEWREGMYKDLAGRLPRHEEAVTICGVAMPVTAAAETRLAEPKSHC